MTYFNTVEIRFRWPLVQSITLLTLMLHTEYEVTL